MDCENNYPFNLMRMEAQKAFIERNLRCVALRFGLSSQEKEKLFGVLEFVITDSANYAKKTPQKYQTSWRYQRLLGYNTKKYVLRVMQRIGQNIKKSHNARDVVVKETPEDICMRKEEEEFLMSSLKEFDLRERFVLESHYGLDEAYYGHEFSLEEIGNSLGITRERVRQIERKVLEKLSAISSLIF